MKEIVELKAPVDRVNHDLDKYEGIDFFPEKTKRANEMIAKWGLPKELEDEILEEKREKAFEIERQFDVVYNPELDKYEGKILFPKKLAEAQETLAKYGLPKDWEDEIQERERKKAVWIKGQLSEANIETNTFLIVVEATESQPQLTYMVSTLSDVLQRLVKDYWGQLVNVHIKPKKEVPGQYELIEVV